MILSGKAKKNKKSRFDNSFILIASLLVVLLAILGISPRKQSEEEIKPEATAIYCDAETVDDWFFVNNGHKFEGAHYQDDLFAHSGQYSCKLGTKRRFGLIYTFQDPIPGTKYKASVWRYPTSGDKGYLIIEGNESTGFFLKEEVAVEEKNGWEKVQVVFAVPEHDSLTSMRIYVSVPEKTGAVFFDDLLIEQLQRPPDTEAFNPDAVHLKIEQKAYNKFNAQKWDAVKQGLLFSSDEDREPGFLSSKNESKEIPVKLRLKGDWLDHLHGDKWSFRIKASKQTSWKGMITFSVQSPKTRYYLHEWVFHKILEKEGVLSPRYDFIELKLNEKNLGIYAYEEHFDKQLPESQARREGPIVKLTEDLFWLGIQRENIFLNKDNSLIDKEQNAFDGSDIRAFKETQTKETEVLAKQFQVAQTLLHQFKYNLKPANEIFDIEKTAKYFAVMDLLSAYHGLAWHNLRFYYNPVLSKLEPIGFDGYGPSVTEYWAGPFLGYKIKHKNNTLFKHLFQDPNFFSAYVKHLDRVCSREYLQDFFIDFEKGISERELFIQKEFPDYSFNKKFFIDRAEEIHALLKAFSEHSVRVRAQSRKQGKLQLKVVNNHNVPVELIGFGNDSREISETFQEPVFIFSTPPTEVARYTDVEIPGEATFLFFKVAGLDSVYHTPIIDWKVPDATTPAQRLFKDSLQSSDLFVINEDKILFKKGALSTVKDIIIPDNYQVFIGGGTQLDLQKGAAFISKSPVFLLGYPETPIKIFSSDGTGNGFTVLQAPEQSEVKYTLFDNLNTLKKGDWELTGAVNFYESDVLFENCSFLNNNCEDGLNIIRSKFMLSNSLISNTFADGFDADFCQGTIKNTTFDGTTNDAMDFSGSHVLIHSSTISNAGDKGISVGEDASVRIRHASIEGANAALASKDLSTLEIEFISLKNCLKGFTIYQKKPEYGTATITVKDYTSENVKHLYLLDRGSILNLKGEEIVGE